MKNKITKKKIKELLIQYLSSTEKEIIYICNTCYYPNDRNFCIDSIKVSDFVDYYLTEYGYYYDIHEIKNKNIYELIKIFLDIFYYNKPIFAKYKKFYLENKLDFTIDKKYIKFKYYEIDKKIFNKIDKFLKDLEISVIKNKKSIELDFSNALFLEENKKTTAQKLIIKYIKIKALCDENSIDEKMSYLSSLKNELDDLVKGGDIKNEYLKLETTEFRSTIQSLFSHKGLKTNNSKFEEKKTSFNNSPYKNKILNEIFDAFVLVYLYNRILN